jgi:hypothetical protein
MTFGLATGALPQLEGEVHTELRLPRWPSILRRSGTRWTGRVGKASISAGKLALKPM